MDHQDSEIQHLWKEIAVLKTPHSSKASSKSAWKPQDTSHESIDIPKKLMDTEDKRKGKGNKAYLENGIPQVRKKRDGAGVWGVCDRCKGPWEFCSTHLVAFAKELHEHTTMATAD